MKVGDNYGGMYGECSGAPLQESPLTENLIYIYIYMYIYSLFRGLGSRVQGFKPPLQAFQRDPSHTSKRKMGSESLFPVALGAPSVAILGLLEKKLKSTILFWV